MRVLFMGTPDFALFSLKALVESGEEVIGVVTQPDKPKGRGKAMSAPPVKVYAEEIDLPVYQPSTMRDEAFWPTLCELDPELIVVTAYGKILPIIRATDASTYTARFCPHTAVRRRCSAR